jgi:hypothetical protein
LWLWLALWRRLGLRLGRGVAVPATRAVAVAGDMAVAGAVAEAAWGCSWDCGKERDWGCSCTCGRCWDLLGLCLKLGLGPWRGWDGGCGCHWECVSVAVVVVWLGRGLWLELGLW